MVPRCAVLAAAGLTVLSALACGGGAAEPSPPEVSATVSSGAVAVAVSAVIPEHLGTAAVPFTAEPYNFVVRMPVAGGISEADVLGSGVAMDLDGDGTTTGAVDVSCRLNGDLVVGSRSLRPRIAAGDPKHMSYGALPAPLTSGGATALYYGGCPDEAAFGLTPGRLTTESTPGPALAVVVVQPGNGTPAARAPVVFADVKLDGAEVAVQAYAAREFVWSAGVLADWHDLYWINVPAGFGAHDLTLRLESDDASSLVVLVSTTWSGDGVDRNRTDRAVAGDVQ